MFFVRIGSLLAWVGFFIGAIYLGMGIFLANNLPIGDPEAAAQMQAFYERRYGATTGGMVDRGLYVLFGSVVLGMLAKIAKQNN